MNKIKLIALDLDGTALHPSRTVSEATVQAVARAREDGIDVVLATGRNYGEASEFAQQMGTNHLMVTSGGAVVSSMPEGRSLMRVSLPWKEAVRAAEIVERMGMTAMIYHGNALSITPYDDRIFSKYKFNEGYLSSKQIIPSITEYIATHKILVDKILILSVDAAVLANARAQLEALSGIRVLSSAEDNIEVMSPAADKGTALSMLCRMYGTDLSHTAAIGDSENDMEMLEAVHLPIAMGNASDTVKQLCKWVTASNAEEGVAKAIEDIIEMNRG